jgi:hypothetical protein
MIQNSFPNPLDNFRSYSYHYILSVSHQTTVFESMINGTGSNSYLSSVLNAKHPGAKFTVSDGGEAWLVADTRRFSAYSITNLSMTHIYGTGSQENPSVPSGTFEMTLQDTTGMSFMNMLMDLFGTELQTTRASAFFLLTILFVGHDEDGGTQVISRTNIPCILLSMEFDIDATGSTYQLSFIEQATGPLRGQSMDVVASMGGLVSISAKQTVGDMLQKLEDQLNIKSLDFYRKFSNASGGKGRLVQYMITVPEEWRAFDCTAAARDKNVEQMFKVKEGEQEDDEKKDKTKEEVDKVTVTSTGSATQMTFGKVATIPDAIKTILESSLDVLDLASDEKLKAGQAQLFKIVTNVTSDDTTYVVHFDVFPYAYKKIDTEQQPNETQLQPGTVNADNVPNLLTFNYLFSGLNKDVISMKIHYNPESANALDMAVDIGQSRFARNAADGQVRQDSEMAAKKNTKSTSPTNFPEIRKNDPIFFANQTIDQKNNASSQRTEQMSSEEAVDAFKKKQEYAKTIATMHFLGSMETEMTIRGNPSIIEKYADRSDGKLAPHFTILSTTDFPSIYSEKTADDAFHKVVQQPLANAKTSYYYKYVDPKIKNLNKKGDESNPLASGPDVEVSPIYCKVNMYAPNIDYKTSDFMQGENEPLYTNEFFYQGIYLILTVETSMSDGDFTHTFQLIPMETEGLAGQMTDNQQGANREDV